MSKSHRETFLLSFAGIFLVIGLGLIVNAYLQPFSIKMFSVGVVFSWINIAGLATAWVLYFDKKRVAHAFLIIISKYAFLVLILFWLFYGGGSSVSSDVGHTLADMAALALGFVGYLIFLAILLVFKKEN